MCYFTCQAQKLPILAVFTSFLILCKIKDGGQDGDHLLRRHRPPAEPPPIKYTSPCREDQRLSIEGNLRETGFHQPFPHPHPPPAPNMYHGGESMALCVCTCEG